MKKERRCLKFTGYVYMPDEKDEYDDLRQYVARRDGVIQISNEKSGKLEKGYNFDNMGDMVNQIMKEYKKRVWKRVPTEKQKNR